MNPIEEFLEGQTKPQTLRNYRKSLEIFFEVIKQDPNTYFGKKRNYNQDMKTFISYMEKYKPLTRKARINCVRAFLAENDVKFDKKTKKLIKQKVRRSKPSTQDKVSTPKELKEILQHGTLKDRVLFLFLSSSGMRIDETLQLTEDDIPAIKMHKEGKKIDFPIKVYIRAETTKTETARFTYISNETWDALIEWLKDRPSYLHQAARKSIKKKWENDPHIFPYAYPTAFRMWQRLLEKSEYDEKDQSTDRHRRHIHTLRKYFRIYLAPKAGEDVTELLMGHEDKLNNVYRDKYPESKLAEMYMVAMPDISVFEVQPDVSEINEQLKEKDQQMKAMQEEMQKMKAEILEMRLERLEKKNGIKK